MIIWNGQAQNFGTLLQGFERTVTFLVVVVCRSPPLCDAPDVMIITTLFILIIFICERGVTLVIWGTGSRWCVMYYGAPDKDQSANSANKATSAKDQKRQTGQTIDLQMYYPIYCNLPSKKRI